MTTGRINQVTTLAWGGSKPAPQVGTPIRGTRVARVGRRRMKPRLRPGDLPKPRLMESPRGGSDCPHWVSQRTVRRRSTSCPVRACPCTAPYVPQGEGASGRSRPRAGTGFGVPPNVYGNGGHRPAIHRLHRYPSWQSNEGTSGAEVVSLHRLNCPVRACKEGTKTTSTVDHHPSRSQIA